MMLIALLTVSLLSGTFTALAAPEETTAESTAAEVDEWTCKVCSTANDGGTECSKCGASRPTTTLSVIALIVLVIVIAIGFIKKVNLS